MATTTDNKLPTREDFLIKLEQLVEYHQRSIARFQEDLARNPLQALSGYHNGDSVLKAATWIDLCATILAEMGDSPEYTMEDLLSDLNKRVLRGARDRRTGDVDTMKLSVAADLVFDLQQGTF